MLLPMTPGEFLRQARERHRVSQLQLARRAGTTQSAISRLERGHGSPTVETLQTPLRLLREQLQLAARPVNHGHDVELLRRQLDLTPQERIEHGVALSNFVLRNRGVARVR